MAQLNYAATRAHKEARKRGGVTQYWIAYYIAADGREVTTGPWWCLDAQDAKDCARYHLSRSTYQRARVFLANWQAQGEQVRLREDQMRRAA